jgi:transposase-like protein
MPVPTAPQVVLTDDERETLERWARRHSSAQSLALRCRIVLGCAEGDANTVVAERLGISRSTVTKWRTRFVEHRLDGLHDEPRPGGPRSVTDADVERVIVKTLEETPRDATHWSPARRSGEPTTTAATARPTCTPRSTSPPAR